MKVSTVDWSEDIVAPAKAIFGRFLGLVGLVTTLMMLLGYLPTRQLAGDAALPAMFAGCAIGVVASLIGTVPVYLARNKPHVEAWSSAIVAMAVRLGVVIVLGASLAMSGALPVKPLVIWILISYAGLMIPDTLLSIKILAQQALAETR